MSSTTSPLVVVTQQLTFEALDIVERKYGYTSTNHLGYHDTEHTRQVIKAAITLGDLAVQRNAIHPSERYLLQLAAAFHDIEQDLGSGYNEEASAIQARLAMHRAGVFRDNDLDIVESTILATRVSYDAGYLEQSPVDYLGKLLADADLVSLGSSTRQYWDRAVGLFYEWFGNEQNSVEARTTFMQHQITLLSTHQYYTPEAIKLFTNQAANLAFSKDILLAISAK